MDLADDSKSTIKSIDLGYLLHESIGSDDYENHSDRSDFECNGDITECKQLAAFIVDNLLTKAITKASQEISHSRQLNIQIRPKLNEIDLNSLPPAIQIDFVGSRTPSPEEELHSFDWTPTKKFKFKTYTDQQSTSVDTDVSVNEFDISEKDDISISKNSVYESSAKNIQLNEVRNFAKEYVKNIITAALETAISNTSQQITKAGERESLLRNSRSITDGFASTTWYTRLRHVFTRLMRSACLCKTKEQFRQQNSQRKT